MSSESLNELAKKILYAGMSGNVPTTLIYEMAVEGLKIEIAEKDARIAELEAENARLRAALQPLAEVVNYWDVVPCEDTTILLVEPVPNFVTGVKLRDDTFLTVGHLRDAAKALGNE